VIALPLIARAQGWLDVQVPFALHYLTAYGPMLAALIVTAVIAGERGVRELVGRTLKWRVGLWWFLFAAFSPLALFALAAIAIYLAGGSLPDLRLLGEVNYLPYLGILTWPLWLLNSGLGEEVGWRGFALPRLQKQHSALAASLILAVFWVLWHVPFFFFLETYVKLGFAIFPMFALGVTCGAIVYTWLYNSTGGSVLMAILFHGSFNFITATKAGEGPAAAIVSVLIMVWAVLVVVVFKPANLSHEEKHII